MDKLKVKLTDYKKVDFDESTSIESVTAEFINFKFGGEFTFKIFTSNKGKAIEQATKWINKKIPNVEIIE